MPPGEGKHYLVEYDMTRDDDTFRIEVKAAVSLMVRWVSKEDTNGGVRSELMTSYGGEVRVVQASKHTKC